MKHDDCLFCKIIDGEVPSAKVYEDEHVYAFMDISQVTTGHTLVIPKVHTKDLYDTPSDIAGHLFAAVPAIAKAIKAAFNPVGLNLLNNNEVAAGQTVFHTHLHLIPRYAHEAGEEGFDIKWEARNEHYTAADLNKIAKQIEENLS